MSSSTGQGDIRTLPISFRFEEGTGPACCPAINPCTADSVWCQVSRQGRCWAGCRPHNVPQHYCIQLMIQDGGSGGGDGDGLAAVGALPEDSPKGVAGGGQCQQPLAQAPPVEQSCAPRIPTALLRCLPCSIRVVTSVFHIGRSALLLVLRAGKELLSIEDPLVHVRNPTLIHSSTGYWQHSECLGGSEGMMSQQPASQG